MNLQDLKQQSATMAFRESLAEDVAIINTALETATATSRQVVIKLMDAPAGVNVSKILTDKAFFGRSLQLIGPLYKAWNTLARHNVKDETFDKLTNEQVKAIGNHVCVKFDKAGNSKAESGEVHELINWTLQVSPDKTETRDKLMGLQVKYFPVKGEKPTGILRESVKASAIAGIVSAYKDSKDEQVQAILKRLQDEIYIDFNKANPIKVQSFLNAEADSK